MKLKIDQFPGWREVKARLDVGHSVMVHGPRRAGRRRFLRQYLKGFKQNPGENCLRLRPRRLMNGFDIDPQRLVAAIERDLGILVDPGAPHDMARSLYAPLCDRSGRTLVVIHNRVEPGMQPACFELIAGFCGLVSDFEDSRTGEVTLLVLDDFSAYFFENWRYRDYSLLDHLSPVFLGRLTTTDLENYLTQLDLPSDVSPADLSRMLVETTGGHPGLILALLDDPLVLRHQADARKGLDEGALAAMVADSRPYDELQKALAADREKLCDACWAYESPQPLPPATPASQHLAHLGILLRASHGAWQLCGGVVEQLVHNTAAFTEISKQTRATTPTGEAIDDDDLIVVHLSDFHVGPDFRFHHSAQRTGGLSKAHELLREDLARLGLAERVDALVVSGDFVESGHDAGQFARAREILDAIRRVLGLDWAQVSIVAGNHDIDWTPSDYANHDARTKVSRENYESFCRTVEKDGKAASLITIRSRGGGRQLRILGLDSNLIEGPQARGIGFVGSHALDCARGLLSQHDDGIDQVPLWLVVHHHLFPATSPPADEALERHVSLFANASDLLNRIQQWRAEIILHGHEHQPSITVAHRWTYPPRRTAEQQLYPLVSAGAGSFALSRHLGPVGRNHYYVVHRRQDDVLFYSRLLSANGLGFTDHDVVHIPMARLDNIEKRSGHGATAFPAAAGSQQAQGDGTNDP